MIGTCAVFLRSLIICASSNPVMPGHADVENQQCELVGDQREQRLIGRFGADQPVVGIVEYRLEDSEIFRLVVDDQNVDWVRAGTRARGEAVGVRERDPRSVEAAAARRGVRSAVGRIIGKATPASATSSWSVFTGLAM